MAEKGIKVLYPGTPLAQLENPKGGGYAHREQGGKYLAIDSNVE